MTPIPPVQNPNPASPPEKKSAAVPPKNRRKGRLHRLEVFSVVMALLLILLPILAFINITSPGPLEEKKTVIVPYGNNIHEIAQLLSDNGVVRFPIIFRLAVKLFTFDQLKSGEYEFTPHQSASDIALMMHDGRSVVHWFKVAEGLTSSDIVLLLDHNPDLIGTLASTPQEGSMLPDTYRFSYGDKRQDMVSRMQKQMQETLNGLWTARDPTIPLKSPAEAIIMASVIEKETGKAEERPRIAGVFYNRLRQGMRLQSDPTVIYAILQAKGPLTHPLDHNDLSFPSPINTYFHDGLPSQPICNPGRASLEAVLHPEKNDFIYFVADGSGGHVFAKLLAEHNRNVAHRRKNTN